MHYQFNGITSTGYFAELCVSRCGKYFTLEGAIIGSAVYCWENWSLPETLEQQRDSNRIFFFFFLWLVAGSCHLKAGLCWAWSSYGDHSVHAAHSYLDTASTDRIISSNAYLVWLSFCILLYREVSAKGHRRATVYFFFKQNQLKDLEQSKLCCRAALACIPIGDLSMWTSTVGKSLQLP